MSVEQCQCSAYLVEDVGVVDAVIEAMEDCPMHCYVAAAFNKLRGPGEPCTSCGEIIYKNEKHWAKPAGPLCHDTAACSFRNVNGGS